MLVFTAGGGFFGVKYATAELKDRMINVEKKIDMLNDKLAETHDRCTKLEVKQDFINDKVRILEEKVVQLDRRRN